MGILSRLFGGKHKESCECPECAPEEKPKRVVKKKVKKRK